MAYSYVAYTGNGSTTQYAVPFGYIRREHVYVSVNQVNQSFTWVNASLVQLASAPAAGTRVEVRRSTPAAAPLVDFTDGSTPVAADFDTSNLQHLYIEQEIQDNQQQTVSVDPATGLPSLSNNRLTNVGNPVVAQDAATKSYVDGFVSQTANIANSAVTTAKVADGAITSAKIADGTIATADLADAAVTTAKIADGSVTDTKLATDSVTTAKVAASAITTAKIADSNVTTAKIADANVTTAKVADGAITSAKIADGTIATGDLADSSVTTAKVADANVTTAKIADANVTTAKIADSNVTTAKIADLNVTTGKLADGAVTNGKLAAGAAVANIGYTPVNKAGDSMTGALGMGGNKITGAGDPTSAQDLATKNYADTTFWNKTSETIDSTEVWANSNTAVPTTAAVNARIVDLLNDVGSYEVVASEVTFPNAGIVDAAGQPDAGVLVAVTDATGLTWNGGGTSTNATRVNGSPVTITGITGTSPITNCGMQVLSTSTLHTYTFVRFTVGTSVAQMISDNITEILQVDTNTAAAQAAATAAAASQSAAATSETNAAAYELSANNWATKTSGPVAGGEYSAKYHAQAAATSAASASSIASSINGLGYYLNWGGVDEAVGSPTTDYGVLT